MPSPFSIIKTAIDDSLGKKPKSWRESLRRRLPAERMHEILADLAEGKAWMAELPDGRCSAPVMPSSDVRLRAAMFLHEALYGKAVAQTEIQKAEQEAKEFEAIRALDDDELERRAADILEARRRAKLTAGPVTDAEFTVIPEKDEREISDVDRIWAAPLTEDQE